MDLIPLLLWFSTEGGLGSIPNIRQCRRDFFQISFYSPVYLCMVTRAAACIWKSEGDFSELVLSFHYVVSRDRTQIVSLGGKPLSLLSHLTSP